VTGEFWKKNYKGRRKRGRRAIEIGKESGIDFFAHLRKKKDSPALF